jgi:hypothetical protein
VRAVVAREAGKTAVRMEVAARVVEAREGA